jgi:hypothetical protein
MPNDSYAGEPLVRRLDTIPSSQIAWLWPGRVPLGKLTLIAGDPGLGKSFVTLDMIARTTMGDPWPDGAPCVVRPRWNDEPGPDDVITGPIVRPNPDVPVGADCVLLSAEDDPGDTIRPRLEALGADLRRVTLVQGVRFRHAGNPDDHGGPLRLDRDIEAIARALAGRPRPRLVVIDPISAYMGSTDCNSNTEVRSVLMRLSQLAGDHGVAVVCVTHLNKGGSGTKAVYRAMGSLAFTAAARMVWSVSKDPQDGARRLMLAVKSNIAAEAPGVAYRLNGGKLEWESGGVDITADEVERAQANPGSTEGAEDDGNEPGGGLRPSERDEAMFWLQDRLREGPVEATRLIEEARANLISEKTLKRAKRELAVESKRVQTPAGGALSPAGGGGVWVWQLPMAR